MISRPSVDLHGCHVLVVDDNEAAALIMTELLMEMGFVVQHASSGPAALQLLSRVDGNDTAFDFVLMDWQMPGMDGLQTVRALRQMNPQSLPLVLMVTAHRRQELVHSAEQLGISHVLSKPVNASVLLDTMMQLRGHAPRLQLPSNPQDPSALEARMAALRGARILLVEDNEINQLVACELLREVGLQVDVADNGQVGVNQVHARFTEDSPYDLVLMDMQMPVMDGITATRLIREIYPPSTLPIVAMTANAMQSDRERCLAAGMTGFVSKPIDPDGLWQALLAGVRMRPGLGQDDGNALSSAKAADTSATDGWPALHTVPGLDASLGLRQCNHNASLYLSMLRRFVVTQAAAMQQLRNMLEHGQTADAERLAHTLKGLAASLGAQALCQEAGELEHRLQASTGQPLDAWIVQTEQQLDALIAALRALPGLLLPGPADVTATLSPDQRERVQGVVQTLQQMLEQDDSEAATLWQTRAPDLRAVLEQPQALEQAITGFDFEAALRLLRMQA
jgi:two-component system sensor histidine kinase/response regulator